MDPKMIEMNNLRVLNDYLTQTLEVLGRSPRIGGHPASFGYSPFTPIPATAGAVPTDTVYGPGSWGFGGSVYPTTPFAAQHPFTGMPVYGAGFGPGYAAQDPFLAQRGFGAWQQPWGQISEVSRQAQFTQALAAKQSVLEAMCRACGIPV
jgi:hypothetical protein